MTLGPKIWPGSTGLRSQLDTMQASMTIRQSSPRVDLWINGTTGDDANDGTDEILAVQTWDRLSELVPDCIDGLLVINVRGRLELPYRDLPFANIHQPAMYHLQFNASNRKNPHSFVLFDGGSDLTAVAGPFISTGSTTGSLVVSEAGWADNQWRGFWAEVVDGPLAGQNILIERNTTDTIYFLLENHYADPGIGTTFNVVRPATEITTANGGADVCDINFTQVGVSTLWIQRLYLSGGILMFGGSD